MEKILRRTNRKLKQPDKESLEELLKATQGMWRKGDGLEYQREIREEWEERLTRFGVPPNPSM